MPPKLLSISIPTPSFQCFGDVITWLFDLNPTRAPRIQEVHQSTYTHSDNPYLGTLFLRELNVEENKQRMDIESLADFFSGFQTQRPENPDRCVLNLLMESPDGQICHAVGLRIFAGKVSWFDPFLEVQVIPDSKSFLGQLVLLEKQTKKTIHAVQLIWYSPPKLS